MINNLNKKDIYIPLEVAEKEVSYEVKRGNKLVAVINRMRQDIMAIFPKQILIVSNSPYQMYPVGMSTQLKVGGINLYTGDLVQLPTTELGIIIVEIDKEEENPFTYYVKTESSKIELVQSKYDDDFVGSLYCEDIRLVKMVHEYSQSEVLFSNSTGHKYTAVMKDHDIKTDLFMDLQFQRGSDYENNFDGGFIR